MFIQSVTEFHEAFNLPLTEGFTIIPLSEFRKRKKVRDMLTKEEMEEIQQALREENLPAYFDGLCDLLYIACGNSLALGLGNSEPVSSCENHAPLCDIKDDLDFQFFCDLTVNIQDGVHQFLETSTDIDELAKINRWLMQDILDAAYELGLPIEKGFQLVHTANMAKLGPDRRPLYNEFGKVMKPAGWQAPDLSTLLG